MLRCLIAAFWTSILAYDAQLPQATWENYLDQAIELQNAGRLAEAEVAYVSAMQEAERLGSEDPAVARVYMNLGRLSTLQHDYSAARLALERSLNITEKTFGADHFAVGLLFVAGTHGCFSSGGLELPLPLTGTLALGAPGQPPAGCR